MLKHYRSILLLFHLIDLCVRCFRRSHVSRLKLGDMRQQLGRCCAAKESRCKETGRVLFSMLTAAGVSAVQKSMDVAPDTAVYL